jgi:hypothetical protein
MSKTLLLHNGKGVGAWVDTRGATSGDYSATRKAFGKLYGGDADLIDPWETTSNGVKYDWWLASSQGAGFMLVKLPDTTKDQIDEAKREIRRNRDVVVMRVTRIDVIVEFPMLAGHPEIGSKVKTWTDIKE